MKELHARIDPDGQLIFIYFNVSLNKQILGTSGKSGMIRPTTQRRRLESSIIEYFN